MGSDPNQMAAREFGSGLSLSQEPLPEAAADLIRSMIDSGRLGPGDKLPSEPSLASTLSVSRGTVRAALGVLQQQGLVWRRQGLGTFVSGQPFLHNRLDLYQSLTDLVAATGRTAGTRDLAAKVVPADKPISTNLQVSTGTPLVCIRRTRTADDEPVVAAIDYFPLDQLGDGPDAMSLTTLCERLVVVVSLQRLFTEDFGVCLDHAIAAICPVKVDRKLLRELRLPVRSGSVLLRLEQTDFDRFRRPIITGYEYHTPEFCQCTIYRRR